MMKIMRIALEIVIINKWHNDDSVVPLSIIIIYYNTVVPRTGFPSGLPYTL